MLIDTGCSVTMLHNQEFLGRGDLNRQHIVVGTSTLSGVSGKGLNVHGMKEMQIRLAGGSWDMEVPMADLTVPGILGLRALS